MNRIRLLFLASLWIGTQVVNAAVGDIPKFAVPDIYSSGKNPFAISIADFNQDSNPDFAVANFGSEFVSVYINNGDGTFQAKVDYSTGQLNARPRDVVIGDFNGDGAPDMASATNNYYGFVVYMNNGDGTFANAVAHSTSRFTQSLNVADFNNDGADDLFVKSDHVSVYLNDGAGMFTLATETYVASYPGDTIIEDFNKDGNVDVAVTVYSRSEVQVHMGNGDGSFLAKVSYPSSAVAGMTSLDVNNDTFQDFVVINPRNRGISTFVNNGDGTFTNAGMQNVGTALTAINKGDFNQDGIDDVAVSIGWDGKVLILTNVNGTFVQQNSFTISYPVHLKSADFNRDGITDLVVSNHFSETVSILNGKGNATFNNYYSINTSPKMLATTNSDFNGDGNVDLATLSEDGHINIVFNNGDGTYAAPVAYFSDSCPASFVSWHYNVDNAPDLAVANACTGNISIFVNDGMGGFGTPILVAAKPAGRSGQSITADDFNNDNRVDLALASGDGGMSVILNNGDSTFTMTDYSISRSTFWTWEIVSDDLNGDNMPDLVVTPWLSNKVTVFINNGDGTFSAAVDYPTPRPTSVSLSDFNNDGFIDMAVGNSDAQTMTIFTNTGFGTFTQTASYPMGKGALVSVTADFNNDGNPDIAFANKEGYRIDVFINDGTGLFNTRLGLPVDMPTGLTSGDFNNDGMQDMAVGGYYSGSLSLLMNIPSVQFTPLTIETDSVEVNLTDQKLELEFDVVFGTRLEPTDVISVTVDGVVLLETTFAEFKQEDPSEMEYEYELGSLEAEIDIVDGQFEIENEAMDFSNLNLIDGLDVVITIGNAQGAVQVPVLIPAQ